MKFGFTHKKIIKIAVVTIIVGGLFALFAPVFAQTDLGLNSAAGIGLGNNDLKVTIANVIRIILSFLGILAVGLIIYAGFVWMTAAGDAHKVEQAKKILIGAIIGLIIILSAFVIASFVISNLRMATGIGNGSCSTGSVQACGPDNCGTQACIDNTWGSCDTSSSACSPFYSSRVTTIKKFASPSLSWSRSVDFSFNGVVSVPARNDVQVTSYARNRGGSMQDFRLLQLSGYTGTNFTDYGQYNPFTTAVEDMTSTIGWNTGSYPVQSLWSLKNTVKPGGLGSNFESKIVKTKIRPVNCFNGIQDAGETGIDCGGNPASATFCGACSGESCSVNNACSNENCANGACLDSSCKCAFTPIIDVVDPNNGATHNLITIVGRFFGDKQGMVLFDNTPAILDLGANCVKSWTNRQIIVEIPDIAQGTRTITVVTNSDFGGLTSNGYAFTVNDIVRPGICNMDPRAGIYPDKTNIFGKNFPVSGIQNVVWSFSPANETSTGSSWTNQKTVDTVPENKKGKTTVRVYNGSQYSNYFIFLVSAGGLGDPCGLPDDANTGFCSAEEVCKTGLYCDFLGNAAKNIPSCTCQLSTNSTCNNNGIVDGNEQCDGTAFKDNKNKCTDKGLGTGDLLCTNKCTVDTSKCSGKPAAVTPAAQAIYGWVFSIAKNPNPIISCGSDEFGTCNANGCSGNSVCNVNGNSDAWIELYNPGPATNIANYELTVGGRNFKISDISTNTTIPNNGFLVIDAAKFLPSMEASNSVTTISLKSASGSLIDDMAYGSNKLPLVYAPGSLGRRGDGLDTDKLFNDFSAFETATRGTSNGVATAAGHMVINEVSFPIRACTCQTAKNTCGNGLLDAGEFCDVVGGSVMFGKEGGDRCETYGWGSGTVACKTSTCTADKNSCSIIDLKNKAAQAVFTWPFTYYKYNVFGDPEVVEECGRYGFCGQDAKVPSPTPWSDHWTAETHGSSITNPLACVDAVVLARFTVEMDPTTLNSSNVLVLKKNSDQTYSSVTGSIVTRNDNSDLKNDYFRFIPSSGELSPGVEYKVIIRGGSTGVKSNYGRPLYIRTPLTDRNCDNVTYDGSQNSGTGNYCWNFQTRTDAIHCKEGCIGCSPSPTYMWWRYAQQLFTAQVNSEDNVCLILNPSLRNWQWSKEDNDNNPSEDAITIQNTQASENTGTALQQTILNDIKYAEVRVNLRTSTITSPYNYCKAYIDFTNPIVEESACKTSGMMMSPNPWPNSEGVCTNALVGARFSTAMYHPSINKNSIVVEKCSTARNLQEAQNGVGCQQVDLDTIGQIGIWDYTHDVYSQGFDPSKQDSLEALPEFFLLDRDNNHKDLDKNMWYRVFILGGSSGVRGSVAVQDGRLVNTGNPNGILKRTNTNRSGAPAYYWVFKTGNAECPVDSVRVTPSNLFMPTRGLTATYNALPENNLCYILQRCSYNWDWKSVIDPVKDVVETGQGVATITKLLQQVGICSNLADNLVDPVQTATSVKDGETYMRAHEPSYDKSGWGFLQVGYPGLEIINYKPSSTSCSDELIHLKFNTDVRATSTLQVNNSFPTVNPLSNIRFYKCGSDAGCSLANAQATGTQLLYPNPNARYWEAENFPGNGTSIVSDANASGGAKVSFNSGYNFVTFNFPFTDAAKSYYVWTRIYKPAAATQGRGLYMYDSTHVRISDWATSATNTWEWVNIKKRDQNTNAFALADFRGKVVIKGDGLSNPLYLDEILITQDRTFNPNYNIVGSPELARDIILQPTKSFSTTTESRYRVVIMGGETGLLAWNSKQLSGLNYFSTPQKGTGEGCDVSAYPWNTVTPSVCTNTCVLNRAADLCGTRFAECDKTDIYNCNSRCQWIGNDNSISSCGNNIVEPKEECDDGNTANGDGCSDHCLAEGSNELYGSVCGNGRKENGEGCDDGNTSSGDGCSSKCLKEGSLRPSGSMPNASICGNGKVEPKEQCDDGNFVSGDGCSGDNHGSGIRGCLWEGSVGGAVCGNGVVDNGKPDSFSWTFNVNSGATTCYVPEIYVNNCPNGIWEVRTPQSANSKQSDIDICVSTQSPGYTNESNQIVSYLNNSWWGKIIKTIRVAIGKFIDARQAVASDSLCGDGWESVLKDKSAPAKDKFEILEYNGLSDRRYYDFIKKQDWIFGNKYKVVVKYTFGGTEQTMESAVTMNTTTASRNCTIGDIKMNVWPMGESRRSDTFFCYGNECGRKTSTLYDDDISGWSQLFPYLNVNTTKLSDPLMEGNQHLYQAWAVSTTSGYMLKSDFDWRASNPSYVKLLSYTAPGGHSRDYWVTSDRFGGDSYIKTTVRGTDVSATTTIKVFLCDNPWPDAQHFPYTDSKTNCSNLSAAPGDCKNTNFEMYYCRDFGNKDSVDDDLPVIKQTAVMGLKGNPIFKDFIFGRDLSLDELEKGWSARATDDPTYKDFQGSSATTGVPAGVTRIDNKIIFQTANSFTFSNVLMPYSANAGQYYLLIDSANDRPIIEEDYYLTHDMVVTIDGVNQGTVYGSANSTSTKTHYLKLKALSEGSHTVTVTWNNDMSCPTCPSGTNCGYRTPGCKNKITDPVSKSYDSNLVVSRVRIMKASSDDVLGLRVADNSNHYGPLYWYRQNFDKNSQGNPSSVIANSYQGVKEGRTAYVNAADLDDAYYGISTYVYLMSYNQNANDTTKTIYNRTLDNLHFNAGLTQGGLAGSFGTCSDSQGTYDCLTDADCKKVDLGYCSSRKAALTRDTQRVADLQLINSYLDTYHNTLRCSNDHTVLCSASSTPSTCYGNGICGRYYPDMAAGTYMTGRTFSVWPSWQTTLGTVFKSALPIDPRNEFIGCSGLFDKTTCWNELNKAMMCPLDAYVYTYNTAAPNNFYNILSAHGEYDSTGTRWYPNWSAVKFMKDTPGQNPFSRFNVTNMCKADTKPVCGNSIVEGTEQCDLGQQNGTIGSGCRFDCTRNTGILIYGSQCTGHYNCNPAVQSYLLTQTNASFSYAFTIASGGNNKNLYYKYSNTNTGGGDILPPADKRYTIDVKLKKVSANATTTLTTWSLPANHDMSDIQTQSLNLGKLAPASYVITFDWTNDLWCPPLGSGNRDLRCEPGLNYDVNLVTHSLFIQ